MIQLFVSKNFSMKLFGTAILALTLNVQTLAAKAASTNSIQTVDFTKCSEFVGLAPIPLGNVKNLVPQSYAISGTEIGKANLVVRSTQCEGFGVGNSETQPGTLAQVGVNIVSPDGTGDINNYTLWYVTNNLNLATILQQAGINAKLVPALTYNFTSDDTGSGGNLDVNVPLPANPSFTISGYEFDPPSTDPSLLYVANWWQSTQNTTIKTNTTFPNIRFANSAVTLYTDPNSDLGNLIGRGSTAFTTLSLRGRFDEAHMDVIVTPVPEPSFDLSTVLAALWMGFLLRLEVRKSKRTSGSRY
ncbi:hypothetical protein [Nostoc sp.]|uniref:hypothetical protein n=1 Tax=Nostoc sp. TaxID=1180 RepID=UPI002FFB3A71